MAEKEKEKNAPATDKKAKKGGKEGGSKMKTLIVALPLYVIQLIAVYFITANILLDKFKNPKGLQNLANQVEVVQQEAPKEEKKAEKHNIYSINDVVVNPSGTNGSALLLVSIAMDLTNADAIDELKNNEVMVKDKIISILSQKNLSFLSNSANRKELKKEIIEGIQDMFPEVEIRKIYFSKYIID